MRFGIVCMSLAALSEMRVAQIKDGRVCATEGDLNGKGCADFSD